MALFFGVSMAYNTIIQARQTVYPCQKVAATAGALGVSVQTASFVSRRNTGGAQAALLQSTYQGMR